jgi:di/tricarboxylate transporter
MAQTFVALLLLGALLPVAFNRLRSDAAALIIVTGLAAAQWMGLGVLGPAGMRNDATKALSGFGQPVILTLISLFILLRALDKTGVTRLMARQLARLSHGSEQRAIFVLCTATALLSLFMNNLAAGAMLLPSAIDIARRSSLRASRLLIPVAFGSLLGGSATYFTTAHIIASELLPLSQPPQPALSVLAFTPVGGLIALGGIALLTLAGRWLLPLREPHLDQTPARSSSKELEAAYQLGERLWEAVVDVKSTLRWRSLASSQIGERLGIAVVAVLRDSATLLQPAPELLLQSGDRLIVIGREERVRMLASEAYQLDIRPADGNLTLRGVMFVEAILAPRSNALGHTLKSIALRANTGFTAVALWRGERSYRTDVASMPLQFGDSLLLAGPPQRLKSLQALREFIVLEADTSDAPLPRGPALLAGGLLLGAVLAAALGAPTFLAMLFAAVCAIVLGLVPLSEAYREIEWPAIFLVGGMFSAGAAMTHTGLAAAIGQYMIGAAAPFGALGLAAGAFLLSAALTQVMGGQVSILVSGPVAISAALSLNVNPQAIAIAAALGCSAAYLTPMAHPVNALVTAPGNYLFSDFARAGLPLLLLSFVLMLLGMRLFWGL